MVQASLRPATRRALRQAMARQRPVTVQVDPSENGAERMVVTVAPLNFSSTPHFGVSFMPIASDAGASPPASAATVVRPEPPQDPALEDELRQMRRELQSSVEAFEASTEELKASNEEVTSINEELQSSNEELETSKEELQSLNEELVTVNGQLQAKVLELEALTGDLDNLLSSTDIAVVFLDRELNVRRFTPAIADLLELRPADIGRPLAHLAQKFTDGDLIADAAQVIAKLAALEAEVLSHSGRWYMRRTLPYLTDDKRIAGVVITFIDISTRKQAAQAIEAERTHLKAVIEQMPAAVLLIEAPSGKLLYTNRQAAVLFSQPFPVPCIGHEWTTIYSGFRGAHANQRSYEPHEWPLARALATGEVILDEELEFVRSDGARATVSMSAAPVRNAAGEAVAAVTAFWDITDRKAADEHLQQALHSARQLRTTAERANLAKDEFISTVSHELRTPLNTIRLWSRMFASGMVREGDVVNGGKMIDRAALAQQQLIDDLLDVSRMASGQLRINRRDTALITTLQAAIEAVQPLAISRRIALTAELSPEIGTVNIDPARIQQIAWNLLANAVKFTPDGGHVEVRAKRQDGTVEIEVTDNGVGIRQEFLTHVFDRFRQGEMGTSRRYAGLGLGLAIAKQLAELHGGTITAGSDGEGRGAKFTVYLPLERCQSPSEAEQLADESLHGQDLRGIEVLLVEDDSMAREATARLLEQAGAQVRAVDSAEHARSALAARRPNIIVADIGMAEEDGYMLLGSVRRTEEEQGLERIPAIAVTAFARSEDRQRALAAGFDDHLPKPLDPARLLNTITQMVRLPREE
jgi:two-component system CheB/CheR fusion protein